MQIRTALLLALVLCTLSTAAHAAEWKAGVAKTVITPQGPMWMAGYASRDRPAEGKLMELWCKALALEDASGQRVVLVTVDVCGVDRETSNHIRDRLHEQFKLGRESIAINCSHTHSGPMVGNNLRAMNFLQPDQQKLLTAYTKELEDKVVATVGSALGAMSPSKLAWTKGSATFAVNRRTNKEAQVPALKEKGELKGPVDHDMPVMTVTSNDGKLAAIVFGYACHGTTTGMYDWSGDWSGDASNNIEKAHPGTTAFFWIGCAGDQNPLPRKSYALLHDYGRQAAEAVDKAISSASAMKPIDPAIRTSYSEIDLPYGPLPTREQLEAQLKDANKYKANQAKIVLGQLDRDGQLSPHYPYPIQVWRLGNQVKWVLLGGEVVVDYSLRLKKELGPEDTWVGAYTNDVMAYIPSLRVLHEGGYEGGESMMYYALPTKWGEQSEELIVKEVHRQIDETAKR